MSKVDNYLIIFSPIVGHIHWLLKVSVFKDVPGGKVFHLWQFSNPIDKTPIGGQGASTLYNCDKMSSQALRPNPIFDQMLSSFSAYHYAYVIMHNDTFLSRSDILVHLQKKWTDLAAYSYLSKVQSQ